MTLSLFPTPSFAEFGGVVVVSMVLPHTIEAEVFETASHPVSISSFWIVVWSRFLAICATMCVIHPMGTAVMLHLQSAGLLLVRPLVRRHSLAFLLCCSQFSDESLVLC